MDDKCHRYRMTMAIVHALNSTRDTVIYDSHGKRYTKMTYGVDYLAGGGVSAISMDSGRDRCS